SAIAIEIGAERKSGPRPITRMIGLLGDARRSLGTDP
ncbi:MAG: hypothetical protein ACI841_003296, partial [Planctomycetota bacterium]